MTTFSTNRFGALLGDEGETDKLGNIKPVEKKEEAKGRREQQSRRLQHSAAVSPPSRRRGLDKNGINEVERNENRRLEGGVGRRQEKAEGGVGIFQFKNQNVFPAGTTARRRQYDRHSATGVIIENEFNLCNFGSLPTDLSDSEKKMNQGWGHPDIAEQEAINDVLEPRDPAAEGEPQPSMSTEREENVKTLDEYRASQKQAPENLRRPQPRQANEGVDDSQWKDAVPFKRDEDNTLYGGKETGMKSKNKTKKEKVFLEINQPPHRSNRGRGEVRRGRGGRGRGQGRMNDINLSDAAMFPTLGA
ncbi:hypothetical protein EC973_001015 [Apophysomyces ossiformis]|uniref:Hyaluronan/mRNA-binding protein domain-containing protein n=1 Tax=Apophysomyces ossiformis TaxID=679940 RepID=A0A8H7BYK3_9FUNG|nr:hypothetical protein EC973_001015 [Apophysomyces ossiformis]